MKKVLVTIIALMFSVNVYANDIQLTDYNYVYAKRTLDGYSTVGYSYRFECHNNSARDWFDKVEEGILKPNGTQLYCPSDFSVQYGKNSDGRITFRQFMSGDMFEIYSYIQPYNGITIYEVNLMNSKGEILDEQSMMNTKDAACSFGDVEDRDEYLKMNNETHEAECDRVDKSYSFKEKQINGQTYYALFKELKDGETAADFMPTEQSTPKYSEYIDQMYKKGLLFNNEMCFYKRGITRLDFGIVLGRAYCNATKYSIDRFATDTHFVDVNNPYCLYLSDNGILTSSNALGYNLYLNEKEITKKDVSDALDKAAEKCGVSTEWKNTKVIQPTDAICSRELAYVETFRLYELIKKHNNPNYLAFTPSQTLDSDSEAETMHYETVSYNASNAETSTEMTTQATAVSGGSASKITFASVIGSVAAIFAGIIAAAKG